MNRQQPRSSRRRQGVGQVRPHPPKMPVTVGQLWCITDFLGSGSFGHIYKGMKLPNAPNMVNGAQVPDVVAIKFESIRTPFPQLSSEKNVIQMMHDSSQPPGAMGADKSPDFYVTANGTNVTSGNIPGFPHYHYYGIEGDYYCLAMSLLGPSLYTLFEERNASRWTYSTVAPLGIQMLDRIEVMHKKGYIHRDVKPDNFLLGGKGKENIVTCIDFGLAKTYRTTSGAHCPAEGGKQLTGTARYASITAHQGMEQSRRDDLEALMYCLIFFLIGKLPWQGLKPVPEQKQKYGHILKVKEETTLDEICRPTGSIEIFRILREIRSYAYNQRPRYLWIRNHLVGGLILRMPISRCLKTIGNGQVQVNIHRLNESPPPGGYKNERIPLPDWSRSQEYNQAAVQLENKFNQMNTNQNGKYLRAMNNNASLPFLMGYPNEPIKYPPANKIERVDQSRLEKNAGRQPTQNNTFQQRTSPQLSVRHRGEAPTYPARTNHPVGVRPMASFNTTTGRPSVSSLSGAQIRELNGMNPMNQSSMQQSYPAATQNTTRRTQRTTQISKQDSMREMSNSVRHPSGKGASAQFAMNEGIYYTPLNGPKSNRTHIHQVGQGSHYRQESSSHLYGAPPQRMVSYHSSSGAVHQVSPMTVTLGTSGASIIRPIPESNRRLPRAGNPGGGK